MGKETLTLRLPSAVIRSRLQAPQKCSDMDVMKLMWPRKPGILKPWARRARGAREETWKEWATGHHLLPPDIRAPTLQSSGEGPFGREHPRPSNKCMNGP